MYIGADYYPEHWEVDEGEQRWEQDAILMEKAGFNITRLAEFSWTKLEPREGEFDFAWLDRVIEVLGAHGVKVILCTPTPTMPKWMYDNYPSTVAMDKDGHKLHFGNRQNNCYSSSEFLMFSNRITRKLAEHYGKNPNVIAWQLDNEFGGPECYCDACENKFREWMKEKYQTIEKLNKEYGTIFWSHSYSDFSQVHLPRNEHSSPSLVLDYKRFFSQNTVSFAKEQADILRECCENHAITHNMMGFAPAIDYYELGKLLDVAAFDYYYNCDAWNTSTPPLLESYQSGAAGLDFTRSIKHKNFWIMENSAGACGWEFYGRNLFPGELRRMTYQNIAHGCDGQIWFRFRTCRYGTEQYWHGLLGHDGIPGRRYHEASVVSHELHKLFNEIEGSTVKAEVAIVVDYDDRWAFAQQPNNASFNYLAEMNKYHKAFTGMGINVEFISSSDSITPYKVVVLPSKYLLSKRYADSIADYVSAGGILITTYRTGVKNEFNVPYAMTLPGFLREVVGVRVEEYEAIRPNHPYTISYKGKEYTADTLVDWVIPETGRGLASYQQKYMKEYASITVNTYGKGSAYYVGAVLPFEAIDELVQEVVKQVGVENYGILPAGLEIVTRTKNDTKFIFVLNHTEDVQRIEITGHELLSNVSVDGTLTIEANDVKVVKQK